MPLTEALTTDIARAVAALPPVLRALLDAELAAGNRIAEVGHSFPAPPVGAFLRLERPVTTRPRASGDGLRFRAHDGGPYAGAFTDAQGFFFLLEPPGEPSPVPDMDAIRAAHAGPPWTPTAAAVDGAVRRFARSMVIDYEKWHDGIGYDLDALDAATQGERSAIEAMLLRRVDDWREVEALARLDTPRARAALDDILANGSPALQLAVLRYRAQPLAQPQRTAVLVRALAEADFYAGLTQALDEVVLFHPPPVVDALWRGLAERDGPVAFHFAATLSALHGLCSSRFDMGLRPFFLRFHCAPGAARSAVTAELRQRIAAVRPARGRDK